MTIAAGPAVVWCPFFSEEEAVGVAETLLDQRLAAGADILAPMRPLFAWKGVRGDARETGVIFKTDAALLDRAVERPESHSYDGPAAIGWRADATGSATRTWLGGLVGPANDDVNLRQ